MIDRDRRAICAALRVAPWLGTGMLARAADPAPGTDPWPNLQRQIFSGRTLSDGKGVIALEMPYRAEDAALVPLTVRSKLPATDARYLTELTIVIDQNPSPVAAVFTFGSGADVGAISTRVRVNSYTNVHAVAELSDGKLYVVTTFVKAAGGCSAPAIKDIAGAGKNIGEMRFRQLAPASAKDRAREAQIMIRHPNNSGLQMDQVTHLYIPAFFISDLKVWQGDELILAMNAGISISENPSLRFTFKANGAASFRAQATDTEKHVFKREWKQSTM